MATVVEKTGKTVEEAISAALTELNLPEDRVSYEVIEEASKGFLGIIGGRLAKVRVTVKENLPEEKALKFLKDVFFAMHIDVKIETSDTEEGHVFNLIGDNLGILIGKHGQTLDALQYLTNLAANHGSVNGKARMIIDVEDYRSRREETLQRLAMRLADKVKRSGDKVVLEPMNRHERKIIHTALQENRRVMTSSSGEEPYRKVVIEPRHNKE
jgi:spoIIIJ-associated protein